ncbi:helix-turn-helix domain-containing protein [Oxalobacter vibrioformis]|uniref:Helix-turn-helix domain-containing protein n=1 Tax=Oxalobacter vibrioformis TaxID=933080 RepID=A0A9E9LWD9_9BURK|nr:helix-turn-helix transcriptional regulator [Oxalobacter vibrioformis]WAW10985.1 helix-turn-helix domain-containing protein [Oxalobacter vibrioformis]
MDITDAPNIPSIFGEVLRDKRLALNISQEELAFRAGVDRTFVSRIERGLRQPTITSLIALSSALGISATELIKTTELRIKS